MQSPAPYGRWATWHQPSPAPATHCTGDARARTTATSPPSPASPPPPHRLTSASPPPPHRLPTCFLLLPTPCLRSDLSGTRPRSGPFLDSSKDLSENSGPEEVHSYEVSQAVVHSLLWG